MTDSIDTSEREAEDPRESIRLPVRVMRDEPLPAVVQVPPGYKLVPVEPTVEMLHAIWARRHDSLDDCYRALLAAAPEAPAQPIPPQWREAMKVAREALAAMLENRGDYTANRDAARAAIAQLDALGGGE